LKGNKVSFELIVPTHGKISDKDSLIRKIAIGVTKMGFNPEMWQINVTDVVDIKGLPQEVKAYNVEMTLKGDAKIRVFKFDKKLLKKLKEGEEG